jgi:hypothetical protein
MEQFLDLQLFFSAPMIAAIAFKSSRTGAPDTTLLPLGAQFDALCDG